MRDEPLSCMGRATYPPPKMQLLDVVLVVKHILEVVKKVVKGMKFKSRIPV